MSSAPVITARNAKPPGSRPVSLRVTVAAAIAGLSFVPNVILAATLILPLVRDTPDALARYTLPVAAWIAAIAVLSSAVGWFIAGGLLGPLETLRRQVATLENTPRGTGARIGLPAGNGEPIEVATMRVAFAGLLTNLEAETGKRAAFMATLVHDLKTPIIANSHVLQAIRDDDAMSRESRVSLVGALIEENRRLLDLVQQMVDAHRFERENVTLALSFTDLGALVQAVAARRAGAAATRHITLTAGGAGRVLASTQELERAIGNLLDNALRYASTRVDLRVEGASVLVEDDGPGLPATLESLAQPFQSQTITLGGQQLAAGSGGLGLFIAREIIAAHGGALEALPGPGARLLVTLRAQEAA